MRFFHALAVLFALFMFVFSLLNSQVIELSFHFDVLSVPVSLWSVAMFLAGGIFAVLALTPSLLKPRRELKRLRQERKALRQELASLRSGPMEDRVE